MFIIREIPKDVCYDMVCRYHYSNTLPRLNKHFLGCYENDKLVGVVTLGWGTRPLHTIKNLFPSLTSADYYEIGRMCMTEEMPRNSESQMISAVCKWIKQNEPQVKVLFTWADGSRGKPGYVYQACSFLYAGFSKTDFYLMNGVKIHPRKIRALLPHREVETRITIRPTRDQMKELGIQRYRGKQFRYIKFLCSRAEKKRLMKECLVPLDLPYPKGDSLAWETYDVEIGRWVPSECPEITDDKIS